MRLSIDEFNLKCKLRRKEPLMQFHCKQNVWKENIERNSVQPVEGYCSKL